MNDHSSPSGGLFTQRKPIALATFLALGALALAGEVAFRLGLFRSRVDRAIDQLMMLPFEEGRAWDALAELDALGSEAVRALAHELRSADQYRRTAAADALGSFGRKSAPAVPSLIDALESRDPAARAAAADALGAIGAASPEVLTALSRMLHDDHRWARQAAGDALRRLMPRQDGQPAALGGTVVHSRP